MLFVRTHTLAQYAHTYLYNAWQKWIKNYTDVTHPLLLAHRVHGIHIQTSARDTTTQARMELPKKKNNKYPHTHAHSRSPESNDEHKYRIVFGVKNNTNSNQINETNDINPDWQHNFFAQLSFLMHSVVKLLSKLFVTLWHSQFVGTGLVMFICQVQSNRRYFPSFLSLLLFSP